MPRKGHSAEQIIYALRQAEAGKKIGDICRELGVSQQAFYSWKRWYAGLGLSELRELSAAARREPEAEDVGRGPDIGQAHTAGGAVKKGLKPAARRELVRQVRQSYQLSEKRACGLIGITRWINRYESRRDPQEALRMRLRELAGRLPGLGSYLQTAANAGDTRAICWGLAAMVAVIVLMDQAIWRPMIAWSEKFKFEQVEAVQTPRSPILNLLRHSKLVSAAGRISVGPLREAVTLRFAKSHASRAPHGPRRMGKLVSHRLTVVGLALIAFTVVRMVVELSTLSSSGLRQILFGAAVTFLRVEFVLLLAGIWTIPVGVFIGLRPRLAAVAQPHSPGRRVGAGHRTISAGPLGSHPGGRRARRRIDHASPARNPVVHPFQCDRGRDCDPDGPQGGLPRLSGQRNKPVAEVAPAGNLPLPDHRIRDCVRRSVECEYCGRVFSFSWPNLLDDRSRRRHQPRSRSWRLRRPTRRHDHHGSSGRYRKSSRLAQAVPDGVNAIQARRLSLSETLSETGDCASASIPGELFFFRAIPSLIRMALRRSGAGSGSARIPGRLSPDF